MNTAIYNDKSLKHFNPFPKHCSNRTSHSVDKAQHNVVIIDQPLLQNFRDSYGSRKENR